MPSITYAYDSIPGLLKNIEEAEVFEGPEGTLETNQKAHNLHNKVSRMCRHLPYTATITLTYEELDGVIL